MQSESASSDPIKQLARVSEVYFQSDMTQAQIGHSSGYSRSMIARLLTESRAQGVVEIHINHPLKRRLDLAAAQQTHFKHQHARALAHNTLSQAQMWRRLGTLAATLVQGLAQHNAIIASACRGAPRWQNR